MADRKVQAIVRPDPSAMQSAGEAAPLNQTIPQFESNRFGVVAIGSSTGGPGTLDRIIRGLPADLPVPIVIAQHMPPSFTESFAASLDRQSPLTVVHAEADMPVLPGVVYVGRGKQHFRLRRSGGQILAEVSDRPTDLLYKPSVDELLRSCAEVYRRRVLAVILTGIGRDGTEGARAVRGAGGVVLAQDRESCVVYGMPKACYEAGLASAVLNPDGIRRTILQFSPTGRQSSAA